jgi:hypothetical protein
MSTPHRATPEQWEHVEICAGMKQQVPWATAACLLELRARVEALEAAQNAPTTTEHRPGGLAERVARVLRDAPHPLGDWSPEARAAIREVAAWLRAGRMLHAAELLEQETDR